uniref:Uncharacterized protein MANES_02G172200 n=1 Tax=Rhizophora mucronata TaxID=61149 RepID=A0A2P2P1H0_RHIMU
MVAIKLQILFIGHAEVSRWVGVVHKFWCRTHKCVQCWPHKKWWGQPPHVVVQYHSVHRCLVLSVG